MGDHYMVSIIKENCVLLAQSNPNVSPETVMIYASPIMAHKSDLMK